MRARELPQARAIACPSAFDLCFARVCRRIKNNMSSCLRCLPLVLATVFAAEGAAAQTDPIAEFYRGKTITLVSSGGVGGPIDLACRVVAKFITRHIPGNPTVVVRNMPGGGHVLMSNYMF